MFVDRVVIPRMYEVTVGCLSKVDKNREERIGAEDLTGMGRGGSLASALTKTPSCLRFISFTTLMKGENPIQNLSSSLATNSL